MESDEQMSEVLFIEPQHYERVLEASALRDVRIERNSSAGLEAVALIPIIVFGTALAISTTRDFINELRGGQVIDLRIGADRFAYRTPNLTFGYVLIVSSDGSVQIKLAGPHAATERFVQAMTKRLGVDASTKEILSAASDTASRLEIPIASVQETDQVEP